MGVSFYVAAVLTEERGEVAWFLMSNGRFTDMDSKCQGRASEAWFAPTPTPNQLANVLYPKAEHESWGRGESIAQCGEPEHVATSDADGWQLWRLPYETSRPAPERG